MTNRQTGQPRVANHPVGLLLTAANRPSGFRRAWPEVVACWKHPTGVWLTIQCLGPVAAVAWRMRPTYAVWPHDVKLFDSSLDVAVNIQEAQEYAESLMVAGPVESVVKALEFSREKNRANAADRYARKKAERGPSKRDFKTMAREAIANVIGGKAGAALKAAIPAVVVPKTLPRGRPKSKTAAQEAYEAEVTRRRRKMLADAAKDAGLPAADCEKYRNLGVGPGDSMTVMAWLQTQAGQDARHNANLLIEMEILPPEQEGEAA